MRLWYWPQGRANTGPVIKDTKEVGSHQFPEGRAGWRRQEQGRCSGGATRLSYSWMKEAGENSHDPSFPGWASQGQVFWKSEGKQSCLLSASSIWISIRKVGVLWACSPYRPWVFPEEFNKHCLLLRIVCAWGVPLTGLCIGSLVLNVAMLGRRVESGA